MESSNYVNLKFKKPKPLVIAAGVLVLLVLIAVFFGRSLLIAATVNGSPVYRLSVIQELEKQSGKQALDAMINKKLVETELAKENITIPQEEIDAEMQKLEAEVAGQGGTLEQALAAQGMAKEDLLQQIIIQKKLQVLLGDKVSVSSEEIDAYIKNSKATPPAGVKMEDFKAQASEQLKEQKLQQEAQKWVAELTSSAKINYYVAY